MMNQLLQAINENFFIECRAIISMNEWLLFRDIRIRFEKVGVFSDVISFLIQMIQKRMIILLEMKENIFENV